MIIERLHLEILSRYNKLNANHHKKFSAHILDDAINKAQDDYVEIFYSGNNTKEYKLGFEITQQRMDMLRSLVVRRTPTPTLISTNKYSVDLSTLTPKYKHYIRCTLKQDGCNSVLDIVRLNDLDFKLADFNTKPSKLWGRSVGVFSDNKIIIYSDGAVTDIELEYLKIPRNVFFGTYDTVEYTAGDTTAPNTGDPKVTTEIDFPEILIDMTVQHLSRVIQDESKFQFQKELVINKT